MARDFSKDVANYMSLGQNKVGPLLDGFAHLMVSAKINADSFDVSSAGNAVLNVFLHSTDTGFRLAVSDGASNVLRISARSQAADTAQIQNGVTVLSTGVTYQVGVIIDIGGDTITPYLDGVADGGGAVTFGAATYADGTPGAGRLDAIGSIMASSVPSNTTGQFDGRISEVGIWASSTAFSADDMLGLVDHSPGLIRIEDLKMYFDLLGQNSPERDYWGMVAGTITGTVAAADHPTIVYPSWSISVVQGAAAPAAGGAKLIGGKPTDGGLLIGGRLAL